MGFLELDYRDVVDFGNSEENLSKYQNHTEGLLNRNWWALPHIS